MAVAVLSPPLWQRLATTLLFCCLLLPTLAAATETTEPLPSSEPVIWQLNIQGVIGPASSDLLIRTIDRAEQANVHLLLVTLDTPGGLMTSMRAMIHRMLASRVPILTWVHPKGARAASAGTYLIYASHLAAMSPATNLGAATPIQMGCPTGPANRRIRKTRASGRCLRWRRR